MKIAIIPARIGSKRIPKKNIKNFCGKPIIYWSIKAAKKTKLFDKIIVSTDDKKIALLAKKYGAEVPFLRSSKLSNDRTGTIAVVSHATYWLKNNGFNPRFVCCIYATAAFIRPLDIINGYKKLQNRKWNYVFSATSFASSVLRSFKKDSKGSLKMIFPKNYYKRTQDLEEIYYDAGQFYWGRASSWLKLKPVFGKFSTIINIPRWRVHDIDTLEDWKLAENVGKAANLF